MYYNQGCQMHCHQQQPQPDINGQVVNEREQLRVQLMELEDRYQVDIEQLKMNLLSESERILQKQLTEQAEFYDPQIHQKDQQIASLTQRLNAAEQHLLQLKNENGQLIQALTGKKDKIQYYKHEVENQNEFHQRKIHEQEAFWRDRITKELDHQRQQLESEFMFERKNYEETILRLKQTLAQFEEKYQQIMFELEKLKQQLQEKHQECEDWKIKYRQLEHRSEMLRNRKIEYSPTNSRVLESKIEELQRELIKKDAKLAKRKNKPVQTIIQAAPVPQQVIVERPVERIVEVERIVPVDRIIRERVPARQPIVINQQHHEVESDSEEIEELRETIKKYKKKMTQILQENANLKQDLLHYEQEREDMKRQYDLLFSKVKELEELLKQRNRELQDRISNLHHKGGQKDDERIVVHVNQGKNKSTHVLKR